VAPDDSAAIWLFHMIQLVEVYQNDRSPSPRSYCSPCWTSPISSAPAWLWTRPFGRPVVPEE